MSLCGMRRTKAKTKYRKLFYRSSTVEGDKVTGITLQLDQSLTPHVYKEQTGRK